MTNLRLLAAKVIAGVTNGESLTDLLDNALSSIKEERDRSFVQAICFGVCRYYSRLDVLLSYLLSKPMKAKDADLHALLLVGLYQLMEMRVPDYAAVAETVNAADKLKKAWGRGLINAVMREYIRQRETLNQQLAQDPEAHFAHPQWWIDAMQAAYPRDWEAILLANNEHPPFSLRVNQQKQSREAYLSVLEKEKFIASPLPFTEQGLRLETPMPVEKLPGFMQGKVSVQDGAAQLAASLLDLKPGMHVLDACAAPGGKLNAMLECEPTLSVVAIEKEPSRLLSIKENLQRLKQQAICICKEAEQTEAWWDGKLFDRILLDAPCSASGVIRRHPDIKLLREAEDIEVLAQEQLLLLESLWPLLAPNGLLLYATCSVFPEENSQVISHFFQTVTNSKEEKINAEWGIPQTFGRQILPGMHQMDGFYYCLLKKEEKA